MQQALLQQQQRQLEEERRRNEERRRAEEKRRKNEEEKCKADYLSKKDERIRNTPIGLIKSFHDFRDSSKNAEIKKLRQNANIINKEIDSLKKTIQLLADKIPYKIYFGAFDLTEPEIKIGDFQLWLKNVIEPNFLAIQRYHYDDYDNELKDLSRQLTEERLKLKNLTPAPTRKILGIFPNIKANKRALKDYESSKQVLEQNILIFDERLKNCELYLEKFKRLINIIENFSNEDVKNLKDFYITYQQILHKSYLVENLQSENDDEDANQI